MTGDSELFEKLFYGGAYALPMLVKFTHSGGGVICLTNNNEAIEFEGVRYESGLFEYTPADEMGKGASLRVSAAGNALVEFVDTADDSFRLDVTAVVAEGGQVMALRRMRHFMGKVSWGDNMEMNFELGSDDRLEMTFPPYKFDSDTNRGNV